MSPRGCSEQALPRGRGASSCASSRCPARRRFAPRRRGRRSGRSRSLRCRSARGRCGPRGCPCRDAPRRRARARRARRRIAPRRSSTPPSSASSRPTGSSPPKRAEWTPGRPPRPRTSIPESSPIIHTPRLDRAAEHRLRARVLVVGLARLRRIVVGAEQLDLPLRQRRAELAQLPGFFEHSLATALHWTPCTNSRSPSFASSFSTACRA